MSKKEELFGIHSVESVLDHAPERLIELFIQKDAQKKELNTLIAKAKKQGVAVQWMQKKSLDRKANQGNHQGVYAVVQAQPTLTEHDLSTLLEKHAQDALFLVLDQVTDPHNLGACLRTADATKAHAVIVPKDGAAKLNPIVRKVASGAAETVPLIVVTNLARALKMMQEAGVWVYGTAGEATQSLYDIDLTGPTAIVMGAEGTGMRRLTRETCDGLLSIPLQGTVDSLNVSVAAGVCLYEAVRQRRQ